MRPTPKLPPSPREGLPPRLFAALFGLFLGLALLKFGNPPIFESAVSTPSNGWELVFNYPWPIGWAYKLLAVVIAAGLLSFRRALPIPWWLAALPLAWFFWESLASVHTVRAGLTRPTLAHFAACAVCFYLGLFCLSRARSLTPFWLGLLGGFLLMLVVGWEQHFGGLEDTRRYFFTYLYPNAKDVQPEYLKKMLSNRIFSTLFYPNSLAGALLLLLPPMLAFIGGLRRRFTLGARAFLAGALTLGALGCLYWSGSKGGWLLMLTLGLLALLRLPFARGLKLALLTVVLVGGLTGFAWKYSNFFRKGATSVVARLGYWQAALWITQANPIWGTGPGTFAVPYRQIKHPEWEMARLTHNDYLEQACDSGLPGFVLYTGFIIAALVLSFRTSRRPAGTSNLVAGPSPPGPPPPKKAGPEADRIGPAAIDWQAFAVWLGVLGWALQSLFEFGLYIPALAWPAFALLGWLLATRPSQETRPPPVAEPAKRLSLAPQA